MGGEVGVAGLLTGFLLGLDVFGIPGVDVGGHCASPIGQVWQSLDILVCPTVWENQAVNQKSPGFRRGFPFLLGDFTFN